MEKQDHLNHRIILRKVDEKSFLYHLSQNSVQYDVYSLYKSIDNKKKAFQHAKELLLMILRVVVMKRNSDKMLISYEESCIIRNVFLLVPLSNTDNVTKKYEVHENYQMELKKD